MWKWYTQFGSVGPAGKVAPERLIECDPGVAVTVRPPHVCVTPFGFATAKPAGSVSVKPTPVSDVVVFGFPIENQTGVLSPSCIHTVSTPPTKIDVVNEVPTSGGPHTSIVAVLVLPVPAPEPPVTE